MLSASSLRSAVSVTSISRRSGERPDVTSAESTAGARVPFPSWVAEMLTATRAPLSQPAASRQARLGGVAFVSFSSAIVSQVTT
jgi:hypothetical protein